MEKARPPWLLVWVLVGVCAINTCLLLFLFEVTALCSLLLILSSFFFVFCFVAHKLISFISILQLKKQGKVQWKVLLIVGGIFQGLQKSYSLSIVLSFCRVVFERFCVTDDICTFTFGTLVPLGGARSTR